MEREWENEEEMEREWGNEEEMKREWGNEEEMEREWGNEKEMEREWGNGESMRKWKEIHSLHFLIFSLFSPSLSISYIKKCHILLQNVKYGILSGMLQKNYHTRYEKIICGRIRCKKGPQVVSAWFIRGWLGSIWGMFSSFSQVVWWSGYTMNYDEVSQPDGAYAILM